MLVACYAVKGTPNVAETDKKHVASREAACRQVPSCDDGYGSFGSCLFWVAHANLHEPSRFSGPRTELVFMLELYGLAPMFAQRLSSAKRLFSGASLTVILLSRGVSALPERSCEPSVDRGPLRLAG